MQKLYDEVTKHKKPDWLKIKLHNSEGFSEVEQIISKHNLHTICSSGKCPNKAICWSRRTATLMILGDICTRSCKFCATVTGRPLPPDNDEPAKVANSVSLMGLRHCVITSVTRDDLSDGGAAHWVKVVEAIKKSNPNTTIELLIPDFNADSNLIGAVTNSSADIIGHNIETVERLTPSIRSKAQFNTSINTIKQIARSGKITKSGIMLGLGETQDELIQTFDTLIDAGCQILTMGQYLRPTLSHTPVVEYIAPQQFDAYKDEALKRGFKYVESGPLVRSSYMAHKAMESCR